MWTADDAEVEFLMLLVFVGIIEIVEKSRYERFLFRRSVEGIRLLGSHHMDAVFWKIISSRFGTRRF